MKLPDWEQYAGPCPRCLDEYDTRFPAISRADNETHVCSKCGEDEGLIQALQRKAWYELPQPTDWPVKRQYTLPDFTIVDGKLVQENG